MLFLRWLPLLVLVISLGITFQWWTVERQQSLQEHEVAFDSLANQGVDLLVQRMQNYQGALLGVAGLFSLPMDVTRDMFHDFVTAERISERYPGIQGVGFNLIVPKEELNRHVALMRETGFPNYSVRPEGEREIYTPVKYIEPFSSANQRALGYDAYSESVRRTSMELARDSGKGALSGKLQLVQDKPSISNVGVLWFLPIYKRGVPIGTPTERRTSIRGWVTAPFIIDDLMVGVFGQRGPKFDIEIYDGETVSVEALIYDGNNYLLPRQEDEFFHVIRHIEIAGRTWTMLIRSQPGFDALLNNDLSVLILVAGISVSLMLMLLSYLILNGRAVALETAKKMTSKLNESMDNEREQRERLTTVVNTVVDAIITVDRSGIMQSINSSGVEIFGYQPEEVIGKNVSMLTSTGSLKAVKPRVSGKNSEQVGVRKDGSSFPMEIASRETEFSNQRFSAFVLRDITERRRIEQELHFSQNKTETTFDNNIVRVIDAMVRGDLTQKITLGASDETPSHRVIGKNFNKMVDQLNLFSSEVTRVAREVGTEGLLGGQAEVPGVAGMWLELTDNVNAMAANLTGQVRNITDVATAVAMGDLTLRISVDARGEIGMLKADINKMIGLLAKDRDERNRALEDLVVAKEGAEAASKIKGDFLANMSHEIRTPMNAILGMSRLCLQTELNDKQREYISKVNQSAQGLLGIINDILDFSKIDADMLSLELLHFELQASLELLDASVGYLAQTKELAFTMSVGADVPKYLVGDSLRLGQVLLNLTSNAVKFTTKGGVTVLVSLREATADGVELQFEVHDTGIGLSPEQIEGLFSAFSQVDTSSTRRFGGTGLGLVISKRLVELMGGRIWVESSIGVGSVFIFTAVFGHGDAQQSIQITKYEEAPIDVERLQGKRILVAEDNEFN
ncbi:MAG: PAS domain S-box-containing protein, partial [Candidatus Azotimanducaceae bacterium]